MTRKYSVDEIDRMRNAISDDLWWHRPGWHDPKDRREDIEHRLRTYMLNGTDPEELEERAKRHEANNRTA